MILSKLCSWVTSTTTSFWNTPIPQAAPLQLTEGQSLCPALLLALGPWTFPDIVSGTSLSIFLDVGGYVASPGRCRHLGPNNTSQFSTHVLSPVGTLACTLACFPESWWLWPHNLLYYAREFLPCPPPCNCQFTFSCPCSGFKNTIVPFTHSHASASPILLDLCL